MHAVKTKSSAALPVIALPHRAPPAQQSAELSRQELRAIILAMIG